MCIRDRIYREDHAINMPLALVERLRWTGKDRTLKNIYTRQEATFPEAAFSYHWHIVGDDMRIFLSLHHAWVIKNKQFFDRNIDKDKFR